MSGSSLDGLDLAYTEFHETGGRWSYTIEAAACIPYSAEWRQRLLNAPALSAADYLVLHADYGHYLGEQVNQFILEYGLQHKVQLVASHGHTVFHEPARRMTAQLGDGAALAAVTGLTVVSDLRAMDVALGGQGAPIVPIGERLLFPGYACFLNLGGIANIAFHQGDDCAAWDVCPANRVLNLLAATVGKAYDEGGKLAATGKVHPALLTKLNDQEYYRAGYPKSLDNRFGTDVLYPMIREAGLSAADALCTYAEHISMQVARAARLQPAASGPLLVTGGGAFNDFLLERIRHHLAPAGLIPQVPDVRTVQYKEALIMALMGILRWREAANVLPSVTGARRAAISGAVWMGG